eukprot:GFYU01007638.1.p1 GENE.GFYU01007638.1~~GFYU01007638.1.p1  ORF type:complete len:320 (+),score=60.83 GFYU01007638.1:26-961(+)
MPAPDEVFNISAFRQAVTTQGCPVQWLIPPVWTVMKYFFRMFVLVYMAGLLYLSYIGRDRARVWMSNVSPDLGREYAEGSYDGSCEMNKENVSLVVNDFYTLVHVFGWSLESMFVADLPLCLLMSVWSEFLEFSFKHHLPNFAECWWDILWDMVCNPTGIVLGTWLSDVLKPITQKQKRTSLVNLFWGGRQVSTFVCVFICWSLHFLVYFYLKNILWVPSTHWVNITQSAIARGILVGWYIGGYWEWALLFVAVESYACVSLAVGNYPASMPEYLQTTWIGVVVVFLILVAYVSSKGVRGASGTRDAKKTE